MEKCKICKKKNQFLIRCRCGNIFCSLHRFPDHFCSFNWKKFHKDKLKKNNKIDLLKSLIMESKF